MKRNEVMALIVTTILMFAVCLSASAKGKRNVERGMTKQEVIAILGEPKLTSFDIYGDKWEYAKYNNLFGDSKYITVFFDNEQLKALKMMAPHIVDLQNTGLIYKVFSFDSEKDKAEEIIRNSR